MALAAAVSVIGVAGVSAALRSRASRALCQVAATAEAVPPVPHGVLVLPYNNEVSPAFRQCEVVFQSCKVVDKKLTIWLQPPTTPDAVSLSRFLLSLYDEAYTAACDANKPMLECSIVAGCDVAGTLVGQALPAVASGAAVLVDGADSAMADWVASQWQGSVQSLDVPDYSSVTVVDSLSSPLATHAKVAVGGTFDHMHAGHRKLLATAAAATAPGGHLLVGLTGPALLVNKKHAAALQSYSQREANVAAFLASVAPGLAADIVQLSDPGGAAATDPDYTAIVVSTETVGGAHWINARRAEGGMPPLDIVCIARRNNTLQSSTWLRKVALGTA